MKNRLINDLRTELSKFKMDMFDAYRIVIHALFIKHLDLMAEEAGDNTVLASYDNRFSVQYLSLTYGEIIIPGNLSEYIKNIEMDFNCGCDSGKIIYPISSDLQHLLSNIHFSQIKSLFSTIQKYDSYFKDAGVFDVMITFTEKVYMMRSMKKYHSSNELAKLEIALLECRKGMDVYSGFYESSLLISELAKENEVSVWESDGRKAAVTMIMTLMNGAYINTGNIHYGDALLDFKDERKYERVICEIFNLSDYKNSNVKMISKGNIINEKKVSNKWLPLLLSLAKLKNDDLAMSVMPYEMLSKAKYKEIQKELVDKYIDSLLCVPSDIIPGISYPVVIMILKLNVDRDRIYMMNLEGFFCTTETNQCKISTDNIKKVIKMYHERRNVPNVSCDVTKTDIKQKEYNLGVLQYLQKNDFSDITPVEKEDFENHKSIMEEIEDINLKLDNIRGRFLK